MIQRENVSKTLKALCEGDDEIFEELKNAYLENFEEFKERALNAIQEQDLEVLREALHKIKPSMLTLAENEDYDKLHRIMDDFNPENKEDYIQQVKEISDQMISALN